MSKTFDIDREKLSSETKTWSHDKIINLSELARKYGLLSSNSGQMIKEYLHKNEIPAASIRQRPLQPLRQCKKRLSSGTNISTLQLMEKLSLKTKLQEEM